MVTPAPALAASKGHLLAIADGVSQCADGGLAARSSLQALALDYYATPETWAIVQSLDRLLLAQNRWLQANGGGQPLLTTLTALVLRGTATPWPTSAIAGPTCGATASCSGRPATTSGNSRTCNTC